MVNPFEGFGFDAHAYEFRCEVDLHVDMMRAAVTGLEAKRRDLDNRKRTYQHGGVLIGEWEDGHKIWDQWDVFENEERALVRALADLPKPFVVSLFHTWERFVGQWANLNAQAKFPQLLGALADKGHQAPERFQSVRDLANLLKHNSANRGRIERIHEHWPGVLPISIDPDEEENCYTLAKLTPCMVEEIAQVVRAAGPDPFGAGARGPRLQRLHR